MVRFRLACAVAAAVALTGCTVTVAGTGTPDAAGPSATAGPSGRPGGTSGQSGTAGPSGTAAACPGAAVTTDVTDLASALPATTPRNLPVQAGRTGPETLEGLLAVQPEIQREQLRTALTAAGFQDAYRRTWAGPATNGQGPDTEVLLVLHFGTPDGACRFAATERTLFSLTPLQVPGVPGALGSQVRTETFWQATATVSKGAYVVEASALSYRTPVVPWSSGLLGTAYAAL